SLLPGFCRQVEHGAARRQIRLAVSRKRRPWQPDRGQAKRPRSSRRTLELAKRARRARHPRPVRGAETRLGRTVEEERNVASLGREGGRRGARFGRRRCSSFKPHKIAPENVASNWSIKG